MRYGRKKKKKFPFVRETIGLYLKIVSNFELLLLLLLLLQIISISSLSISEFLSLALIIIAARTRVLRFYYIVYLAVPSRIENKSLGSTPIYEAFHVNPPSAKFLARV